MIDLWRSWALLNTGVYLQLLFFINCRATIAWRLKAIRSLYFHHLWVRHTVDTLFTLTCGPPHCEKPESCQQWGLTFMSTVAFRATKIATTLRADIPVAFRATESLVYTMLPVNYRNWQLSFSEIPKSCQQWELTFLTPVAFRATKIPTTLRADVPVAFRATKNLKDTMPPVNYRSWQRSFQNYLKLKTLCFLLTVWVDNRRFRRYLSKLRRECFPSAVWVDSHSFQSYFWKEMYY